MSMSHCTEVQERIALGESLPDTEQAHLLRCPGCSLVAETYSLLDASLELLAEPVPDGFADRLMSRLGTPEVARGARWFDAGWAELALVNVAFVCALLNAARFVAGVLIPSVSLGGTP
jgi:hypothetical protein